MNCKYYRTRTKKYSKIGYCTRDRKEVSLFCKECKNIEYKIYNHCAKDTFKNQKCTISSKNCASGLKKKSPVKGKKHKLTKATEIPKKVKMIVWERDEHRCIFCKTPVEWNYANSHYIKRSHSGLGIEPKNIMTNCDRCHKLFEESIYREQMKEYARNYLKSKYDDWSEKDLVYKKY